MAEPKLVFNDLREMMLTRKINDGRVGIFIAYLQKLSQEKKKQGREYVLKNPWVMKLPTKAYADLYSANDHGAVWIDGDQVLVTYQGGLRAVYTYQAYKNMVISVYPESTFDIDLVREGDTYEFSKEDGRVTYTHKIADRFTQSGKILGSYCIIKNDRGEFLNTINNTDIAKMQSKAKTQNVWNEWFDQMVLKSVIKRSCKFHFRDITVNMDKLDNEYNYDMEKETPEQDKPGNEIQTLTHAIRQELINLDKSDSVKANSFREVLAKLRAEDKLDKKTLLDYIAQIRTLNNAANNS